VLAWRAYENAREHRPGWRKRREVIRPLQSLSVGVKPIRGEGTLKFGDHGALDAKMQVAPFIRRGRIALPLIGDADSPDEADLAIHDENFPMRAIIVALGIEPPDSMERFDFDPGLAQRGLIGTRLRRADGIENE